MSENNHNNYIWRCAKCSCHFANIIKLEGNLKQEKKCPKCKSLNILTLTDKEILVQCKYPTEEMEEEAREDYAYPTG